MLSGPKTQAALQSAALRLCVSALTVFVELYSLLCRSNTGAARARGRAQASSVDTLEFWPAGLARCWCCAQRHILQL